MASSFLQVATSATDLTTYTFADQNLDTAAPDRYIVATISGRSNDGGARTINSVTIGGVSATINVQTTDQGNVIGVAVASVPSGTTGDVVVEFSDTMTDAAVALYRVPGITTTTATDTGTSTATPLTTNLDINAGGFAVAMAKSDNSSHTATWTNLTERFDQDDASTNSISGASDDFATAQTSLAITCTWSASTRPVFAAASFNVAASGNAMFMGAEF